MILPIDHHCAAYIRNAVTVGTYGRIQRLTPKLSWMPLNRALDLDAGFTTFRPLGTAGYSVETAGRSAVPAGINLCFSEDAL